MVMVHGSSEGVRARMTGSLIRLTMVTTSVSPRIRVEFSSYSGGSMTCI
jgi:hypothetical protein